MAAGYKAIAPYERIALEVLLVRTPAELVLPHRALATGALLLIAFLAVGWARAVRRSV